MFDKQKKSFIQELLDMLEEERLGEQHGTAVRATGRVPVAAWRAPCSQEYVRAFRKARRD